MKRVVVASCAVLVLAMAGYAVADAFDKVPGVLTIAPEPPPLASPYPTPSPSPSASDPPAPTPAGIEAALAPALADPALGPSVGISVRDGITGTELYGKDTTTARTVASLQKLLAAYVLVDALPLGDPLTTSVVRGAQPDHVVVRAGGDMYLSPGAGDPEAVLGRAGLADLADQVTKALGANPGPLTLDLDTGYAAGPAIPPTWSKADLAAGFTGPVVMLGLVTQRAQDGRPAPADPPRSAAAALADRLRERGLQVTVGDSVTTSAQAPLLGEVRSAPIRDLLEVALQDSDNALVENLTRQAMVRAGVDPASSTGDFVAARAVAAGLPAGEMSIVDASGLSPGQKVTVGVISQILATAADGKHAELRGVVLELAVAGLNGSLEKRFRGEATREFAGVPRAKTGTLTGASAIGGWTVDAQGRPLLYVVVADEINPSFASGTEPARAALDRLVGVLTSCGCR